MPVVAAPCIRPCALYRKQYPSKYFYSTISCEFLRILLSALPQDLITKAKELLERMKQQGSKSGTNGTSLRKIKLSHPESF